MALNFANTTADRVDMGSSSTLDNLQASTICAWVYRTTTRVSGQIYAKGSFANQTRNPAFGLRGNDGSTLSLLVDRATTDLNLTGNNASSATLPLNTWAFAVAAYDTSTNPQMFMGTLTAEVSEVSYATQTLGSGTIGDNTAELGCVGNASLAGTQDKSFPGIIGFISIYNRRLTLGEIQQQQFSPYVTSGCIYFSHLGFNGTGNQVDWSGNKNTGTVTSATYSSHVPLKPVWGFQTARPPYFNPYPKKLSLIGVG